MFYIQWPVYYNSTQIIIIYHKSMTFASTIKTLLHKNYLILKTHKHKYIGIYISPFLILLLLILIQYKISLAFSWSFPNPPQKIIPKIPKCYGDGCVTLGYSVMGKNQPYIDFVVDEVRKANGLEKTDIKNMEMSGPEVMRYLEKSPNKTQFVVVFCTDSSWKIGNISMPCYAEESHLNFYTIIYNLSLYHKVPYMGDLKQAYPKDYVTIKLKKDIDEAILRYYEPTIDINMTFSDFPSKTMRFVEGISVIAQYGSFFFMIPYLLLLVLEGSKLLVQKEKRLRIGLNIVGVSHFQFYVAELLTYFIHVLIISTAFCASGYILDIKFFSKGMIWFDFYILCTNGFILGLLAFCITALVSERNLGMSILYGFVLYSIVMQWMFTGGIIFEFLYLDSASVTVRIIRYIFNLYPSFHFSKLYSDVTKKADTHIDTYENRYVKGTEFKFQDLFEHVSKYYEKPFPHGYILPSPFESAIYLFLTSIVFIVLLVLFDKLIESNRGYRDKICKGSNKKRKNSTYQLFEQEQQDKTMLRVTNLQKMYKNNVFALNGVSFSLKKGEIVSLLGQNGAGKSTLINILIGALSKSRGQAIIDRKDIQKEIIEIRKIIGVCPQFDILWEELTAGEHVEMFYRLKQLEVNDDRVRQLLKTVNLDNNVNGKVSTFSGGMRRRLSMAIALIGDPKLIILDEPTTGMDAKIRLQTWKLILSLRNEKTVFITTHNMQEAQCLSDSIMIMSKGRIIASGTTVELKRQFGEGYVVKGYDRQKGENIQIKCKEDELEDILKQIEKQGVQNWSLHETTLEEVFLNVSNRF